MLGCDSWSRTDRYRGFGTHKWTISNFLNRLSDMGTADRINSPYFIIPVIGPKGQVQKPKFSLSVSPHSEAAATPATHLSVYLHTRLDGEEKRHVKFSLWLEQENGTPYGQRDFSYKYANDKDGGNGYGFRKAFLLDDVKNKAQQLLPKDELTIACEIEVSPSKDNVSIGALKGSKFDFEIRMMPCLGDDQKKIATFHVDNPFSDVSIVSADGTTFYCHKNILSARSDVFAAMLSHDTKESQTNKVEVTDMDADTLDEFLTFLYTDSVDDEDLPDLSHELLRAADKYNVPRLKAICEKSIYRQLTISNAAEALVLADQHHAQTLFDATTEFVVQHFADVLETPEWKEIASPEILHTVMEKMKRL